LQALQRFQDVCFGRFVYAEIATKVEPLGVLLDQLTPSRRKPTCGFIRCSHNPDRQASRGSSYDLNYSQSRIAAEKDIDAVTELSLFTHEGVKFIAKCSSIRLQFFRRRWANCVQTNLPTR